LSTAHRRLGGLPVSALALLLVAACDRGTADTACAPLQPGVPVHAAAGDPARGTLREMWRAGGAQGVELAAPAAFAAADDGRLAVVDYMLGEVLILARDGSVDVAPTRRGRGPGELTMPVAASWKADTLLVFDIEQAKVVSLHGDGVAAPDSHVPAALVAPVIASGEVEFAAVLGNGTALLRQPATASARGDSATIAFVAAARDGATVDTVIAATVPVVVQGGGRMLSRPGAAQPRLAVGSNGWYAVSAADGSNRVLVSHAGAGAVRQLCGASVAQPLTPAELGADAPRGFETDAAALAAGPRPTRHAAVGQLLVGGDGAVWVGAVRPTPFTDDALYGAATQVYEVWDASGSRRGSVHVPEGVRLQAVAGDVAWGIVFTPLDEALIVAYRVEWNGAPESRSN
jgi:hypothetical protein